MATVVHDDLKRLAFDPNIYAKGSFSALCTIADGFTELPKETNVTRTYVSTFPSTLRMSSFIWYFKGIASPRSVSKLVLGKFMHLLSPSKFHVNIHVFSLSVKGVYNKLL